MHQEIVMAKEMKNLKDEIIDLQILRETLQENLKSLTDASENAALARANLSKLKDIKQIDSEERKTENDFILQLQTDMANNKKYLEMLPKTDPAYDKEKEFISRSEAKDKKLLEERKATLQDPIALSESKLKTYKQQTEQCETRIKEFKGKKPSKDDQEMLDGLHDSIRKLALKTKKHEMLLHYHQKLQSMSSELQEAKSDLVYLDENYKKEPYKDMAESQRTMLKNIEKKCLTEKVAALTLAVNCFKDPEKKTIVKKNTDKASEEPVVALIKEVKKEIKTLETAIKQKEKAVTTHMAQEEKRILVDDAIFQKAPKHLTTQFNTHRASNDHHGKAHRHVPEKNAPHPHEKHKGHRP